MNRCLEPLLPTSLTSVSLLVAAINETASLRKTLDILRATCDPTDIEEVLLLLSPTKTTPACRAVAEALVAESTPEFPVRIAVLPLRSAVLNPFPEFCAVRSDILSASVALVLIR